MTNSIWYWFAAFVLVAGGGVSAWSYAPGPSLPTESEVTSVVSTSSEEPEILTDEQMRELEAKSLENSQEISELERAKQELQAYFAQQARQKEDRERLEFEAKMLMIEKGIPLDGSRYSSKIRTDSEGNSYYTDSDGNYVKCRTDSKGTTYCNEM